MRVHLIAICGSGMGQLAQMLKAAGHQVTGSDTNIYPPMSTLLRDSGIACREHFAPQNIEPGTDLVVIGNAVPSTNVEVQEVLNRKIPYLSFPQALTEFFLKDRSPIVVTGTHGKTTTAALMAWVLESAGKDPGMLIGGWARNFRGGAKIGQKPYFVVEGDEYDTAFFDKGPKFLHYRPQWAVLTSIEFDHGDIYKDLDHVKSAFRGFVQSIPSSGLLLAGEGDPHIADVVQSAACSVVFYGIREGGSVGGVTGGAARNGWMAEKIQNSSGGVMFDVISGGSRIGSVESPLLGRHNVRNALAVMVMARHLGLSLEEIIRGIATFQGVKRRQEVLDVVDNMVVIDDFAHHPTAVHETLAAIRMKFPERRVWAVFEPRSATSRRRIFQEAFAGAFGEADQVIVADLYSPGKIHPEERLNPLKLVEDLNRAGKPARFIPTADEIVEELCPCLTSGDVICIMSSGGFGGIHSKLIAALKARPGSKKVEGTFGDDKPGQAPCA